MGKINLTQLTPQPLMIGPHTSQKVLVELVADWLKIRGYTFDQPLIFQYGSRFVPEDERWVLYPTITFNGKQLHGGVVMDETGKITPFLDSFPPRTYILPEGSRQEAIIDFVKGQLTTLVEVFNCTISVSFKTAQRIWEILLVKPNGETLQTLWLNEFGDLCYYG